MKKWLVPFIVILLIILVFVIIINFSLNKENKKDRCLIPKPLEIGGCEVLRGWYYNISSNSCESIGGCSIEGEIPFADSTECKSTCVKNGASLS